MLRSKKPSESKEQDAEQQDKKADFQKRRDEMMTYHKKFQTTVSEEDLENPQVSRKPVYTRQTEHFRLLAILRVRATLNCACYSRRKQLRKAAINLKCLFKTTYAQPSFNSWCSFPRNGKRWAWNFPTRQNERKYSVILRVLTNTSTINSSHNWTPLLTVFSLVSCAETYACIVIYVQKLQRD